MSGYTTYQRWQRIEERAKAFGFRIGNPRTGAWGGMDTHDVVSVFPKDDEYPVYARDAELFTGTFRDLEIWLTGFEKAQQYDMLLRMTDAKRRKKFEDAERERQRVAALKLEQKKMWDTLKDANDILQDS